MTAPASTVVGMLLTSGGEYHQRGWHQPELERVGPLHYRKPAPVLRERFGRIDTLALRTAQRDFIGLNIEHDPVETVGRVEHLELREAGDLWAVGVAYGELPEGPLHFSPQARSRGDGSDVRIEHAALVRVPGQICLPEVSVLAGDLDSVDVARLPAFQKVMLERARVVAKRRTSSSPVVVYDCDARRAERREELYMRAAGVLHRGGGGRVLGVR